MIVHQPCKQDGDFDCMTTNDVRKWGKYDLVVNRDNNGQAEGRLFVDEDDTLSSMDRGNFQYYEFHLSAKSLKKWNLNEKTYATKNIKGLDNLIITNAEDLEATDFACWISETDGVPT